MINILDILKDKLIGTYINVYVVSSNNILEEEYIVGYFMTPIETREAKMINHKENKEVTITTKVKEVLLLKIIDVGFCDYGYGEVEYTCICENEIYVEIPFN